MAKKKKRPPEFFTIGVLEIHTLGKIDEGLLYVYQFWPPPIFPTLPGCKLKKKQAFSKQWGDLDAKETILPYNIVLRQYVYPNGF